MVLEILTTTKGQTMSKLTSDNCEAIKKHLFKAFNTAGEESKNSLPNLLQWAMENEVWTKFVKADGTEFEGPFEWLTASWPDGPALGRSRFSFSYEDLLQLCRERRELHGWLVQIRPDKRSKEYRDMVAANDTAKDGAGEKVTKDDLMKNKSKSPTTRVAIEARLAKDFPEHYARYISGEYRSARQAGQKAGFIPEKSTATNLNRAKSAWRKMDEADRKAFRNWLRTSEAKELPAS